MLIKRNQINSSSGEAINSKIQGIFALLIMENFQGPKT